MPITVKHLKVSTVPDAGDDTLVEPSDWNADHTLTGLGTMAEQNANAVAITGGTISGVTLPASNITGTLGVPNGGTGATTLTGYVKGTGTTAMTAASTIPNTDITGLGTASTKDAGAALGVATLDATGKVPVSELPAAVLGALNYQGTWDASTNSPTLTSSVGTKGYYYVVSVAGSTNLNGITDWLVGDWAVYNGTVWQKVDNTDAGGDVVGPNSATDNAITRFDGVTGRVIQNSVVTVSDTGAVAGVLSITDPNFVDFNTGYTTPVTAGQLGWDGTFNSLALGMVGGNVIQHIGEDTYIYVKASSAITKGQVIMFTGSVGSSGVVTAAPATGVTNGQVIIGVAAETIALNGFGLIQTYGELRNVNTSAFADGDILYYNSAVTGGFTTTFPASGPIVTVAAVVNGGSAGGGIITIRLSVTQRLTASTGISVSQNSTGTSITNTGVTSAVAGTGISVSGATGAVTVTNTAPDQTVAIASGTGISVTGTYPSFTVTNTLPSLGGTVTSVSGTAGRITSTGGTTPVIDLASGVATAGTTGSSTLIPVVTIDTYGRVTSITTAANPQGTVTSVTGTSPVVSSGGATPAISLAASYGDTQNPYASKTANFVLAAPNGSAGVPTFRAIVAADIPTLNQNTTGTASNVTGTVAIANGGTGATTAPAARTALGATTVGGNMFTLTNPSAITFPRFNADNTVSALDAATFRTAIGAGTGSGTVTSVGGTGTVNGITLTGTVTSTGNLTLGGTLSGVSLTTQVTGTLPIANGGTNATTAAAARTNLGATTVGGNFFTLTNPSAITFPRMNADNTVSALDAATFRTAIGAGTGSGTVTSVAALTLGTTGTDLSSSVATGTTTPVITLNVPTASAANRGALSAADWTTFNGKAPAVTYTTNYIPYGQGTTTPNQSAQLQYNNAGTLAVSTSAAASVEGVFTNTNTGVTASAGVQGKGNSTGYWLLRQYGTGVTATVFGQTLANYALLLSDGASSNGLMIGSNTADPVIIGTNNAERMRIFSTGGVSVGNTTDRGAGALSVTSGIYAESTGPFMLNATTVSANFTIPASFNATSAGPITINTGVTVTVSTGSTWVVV